MKVSKLFHWLYASLMLLPLAVFLPTGIYYGFNHEAQAQNKVVEIPIYYESNELEDINSFKYEYAYLWTDNFIIPDTWTSSLIIAHFKTTDNLIELQPSFNSNILTLQYSYNNRLLYLSDGNSHYLNLNDISTWLVYENTLNSNALTDLIDYFEPYYFAIKEYQDITYSMSIVDSMSYAWDDTWHLPLFSWSGESFIAQPFNYITNVFGIPEGSTFNYALSYWCAISIIWMVFDLIMYVPLLVHKWIDKGIIE